MKNARSDIEDDAENITLPNTSQTFQILDNIELSDDDEEVDLNIKKYT